MIYPLLNLIKFNAIRHPIVNMSSVGDISLYDNKSDIKYPYVNIDVVSASVVNYSKKYTIRMYVCDKQNDVQIAYNKTELILDNILKGMDINNYTINFFNMDFQDIVNGVYADFEFETTVMGQCAYEGLFDSNILLEDGSFILLENGDLISLEQ